MKIAQISPLIESVPPKLYGGTERVVSHLTEELVRQGHEVTLFASGDSKTSAQLVPCTPAALRLDPTVVDALPHHIVELELVRRRADEFEILHFHTDYLHFPLFHDMALRTVTTLHGRLDLPDLLPLFQEFGRMPVISISDSQRTPLPHANWVGTVHHGLPCDLFPFRPRPSGGYFAFLGRISPEKRLDRAIEIAARVGVPLAVAAKVDDADKDYYEQVIEPLLDGPDVHFVGEIGDKQKADFLGNADALLFPIDWPEPFGLVMIEAMACGTPVVAWRCGAVPEVIESGVTGFVVESMDEAVQAARDVRKLDRGLVRRRFQERFSVERMARHYVSMYRSLAQR
jgi:glycosyltransferase involved in cell wall biosynthesis